MFRDRSSLEILWNMTPLDTEFYLASWICEEFVCRYLLFSLSGAICSVLPCSRFHSTTINEYLRVCFGSLISVRVIQRPLGFPPEQVVALREVPGERDRQQTQRQEWPEKQRAESHAAKKNNNKKQGDELGSTEKRFPSKRQPGRWLQGTWNCSGYTSNSDDVAQMLSKCFTIRSRN